MSKNLDEHLSKLRIEKERKRPRVGRVRWSWIFIGLAVCGGGYGAFAMMNAPLVVSTAKIEKEALAPGRGAALLTASGYVIPRHKVEISSKIIGRVVDLNVVRGDKVKAGDVLLRIEDEDFQARVKSAEAEVDALRARLAELRAGSRPEEIQAASASVAASDAAFVRARLELERAEHLSIEGIAAKQELDRARAEHDAAQARLKSDRENAELVKKGPRKEQIDAAEAQLRQAEAAMALAKAELEYTVVRAPIDGVILEKFAEKGELVTNSNFGGTRGAKSSVVSMADLADLQVEVDVNQAEFGKVKLGQKTEIRLDLDPEHVYHGKVDEISPQADRQKGSVQVKVGIADPDAEMKTEVNARVTFLGEAVEGTPAQGARLWIPKAAIVRADTESKVFVLAEGKVASRVIAAGIEAERGVEIVKGLSGDETLIVAPLERVKDGARAVAAP